VIAGLILAAGAGTRYGGAEPKLLAEFDGKPLLQHAVDAAIAVPELEQIVVVLGANADAVAAAVDFGRARRTVCPDWAEGQSASLRCGLAAIKGADKVIVTLGDAPLITSTVIARFLDEPGGTRATYDGRPGHPVVLAAEQIHAVRAVTGDRGARDVLKGGRTIECSDLASGADVDTVADLDALRSR
jgi:molybdenum cofactor cytidylyltransferase